MKSRKDNGRRHVFKADADAAFMRMKREPYTQNDPVKACI